MKAYDYIRIFLASYLLTFTSDLSASHAGAGLTDVNESFTGSNEGKLRQTVWKDMLPHTMQGDYYNEFWSYHVFLDDDLHVHLTFSLANFGTFKSPVSGGKLFVSNFMGQNFNISREYPLERLVIDESSHTIRLHPERDIYLTGRLPETHRIFFRTTKDNISYLVDLQFQEIQRGFTWDDGIFRIDKEEMGIFIHIPRASVTGKIAVNKDTLHVSGTAYMDHTFQSNLSSKIVDMGFRYIAHPAEGGFVAGYYLIPKNRTSRDVIGFSIDQTNSPTTFEIPEMITVLGSGKVGGRSVPRYVEIFYESGNRRILSRLNDFQYVSFLDEIGGIRRRLVRSFLGGEVVEYVGTGKLDSVTPINYNFFLVH